MDIAQYKLPDEAFWESDERGADPMARELVGEYEGVLIDAPRRVDTRKRTTLPAGIYQLGPIREVAATKLYKLAAISAIDTVRNRIFLAGGQALRRDSDIMEAQPRDPARMPDGDMSTTYPVELRSMLGIAWQPARLLVTLLMRDRTSNRALVDLEGAGSPEELPPARAEDVFPPADKVATFYQMRPKSPPVPAGPGIVLSPDRIVDLRHDWQWPLYGSFRLAPAPHERTAQSPPAAVLGIHLVIQGADDGGLSLTTLRVPAYERAGEFATGYFAVDLMQLCRFRKPQTYFLTAFCGDHMAGPIPSAIVHPSF